MSGVAAPRAGSDVRRPTLVLGQAPDHFGLRTVGESGAEWALPDGARVIAEPGTTLSISKGAQRLKLATGTVRAYTVALRAGSLRVSVPDPEHSAVIVATPRRTIAIVASGDVTILAGDEVVVANTVGQTSLSLAGGRYHPIDAGTLAVVNRNGESRRPLLPSPGNLRGSTVMLSYGGRVRLGAFSWQGVPGAAGYRVELREADSNRLLERAVRSEPRLEAGLVELEPGAYSMRLVALDSSGLESENPVERSLHVMHLTLPEGGYLDERGAARLPPGAKLRLANVTGVTMTYGGGRNFVPAPSALELFQPEARVVHFRDGGGGGDATLVLLPRTARAAVSFGPLAPSWPGTSLRIRVRLTEAGGQTVPSWIEARTRVFVGVDPVDVSFSTEDGWLVGALDPQPGPGPWVVRVEVADQHGIELGRDFVEIAPARPRPAPDRSAKPAHPAEVGKGS